MKSISGKNWEELKFDNRILEKTKINYNLNYIQAKLILSRNFTDEEIYSIHNDVNFINPFTKSKDFLLACDLLKNHIDKKDKILIIGDYDVDGCISTSLMVNFLNKNNSKVNYYIPDRFKDGYGANKKLLKNLLNLYNPKLIIFLDCGSASNEGIEYIKSQRISSIIIDHHNVNKPYPLSDIFINPKKICEYKKYDYLCTVFLTYLFIDLYIKKNHLKIIISEEEIYVLLGTVADVMPMRGINRILALRVLKNFDINKNFIFKYLFKTIKHKRKLTIDDLGYQIAPIINAAGRIENANLVVELFTNNSDKRRIQLMNKILNLNNKRKLLEKRFFKNLNFANLDRIKGILFIFKKSIPEGIIGIIASKIKSYYNRPCIVFTNSHDIVKGSARSTTDFNIGVYIQQALDKNIILSGGGHNLAAGITTNKHNLNLLTEFLNNHFKKKDYLNKNFFVSKILVSSINKDFFDEINLLGPFGNRNSNPIFLIEKIKIIKPKIINEKFISCFVEKNKKMIKAISFYHLNTKISYEILNSKSNFDIFVKIKQNQWNNKTTIELEIIDLIKDIKKLD